MFYQINSIALSRLTNAAHVAFMSNVKAYIEKQHAEYLGIDAATFSSFTSALNEEQDIVNRSRASSYTAMMNDYDEKRNNHFHRLHYKLRAVQYDIENTDVDKDMITAIDKDLLTQYPLSICNSRAQDKTSKIRGFLYDFENDFGGLIEDLGLENDVAALKKANDDFENTYLSRVAQRTLIADTAEKRAASEDFYHQICLIISYLANKNGATGEEMARVALCKKAVEIFNQLVKEFKQKIGNNAMSDEEMKDERLEMMDEEV